MGASSGPGSREPSPDGLGPSGFDPSRLKWYLPDQLRWLDHHRGAGYMPCGQLVGVTLQQCADIMESQHRRIMAVRRVIENGFPRDLRPAEKCVHGQLGVEDCIACYDEALLAALTSDSDGNPEGQDRDGLDGAAAIARAEGIARTQSPSSPSPLHTGRE